MPGGTIQRDTIEAIGNLLERTGLVNAVDLQIRCISINVEGLGVDFMRVILIISLVVFFVFRFEIMGICCDGSWFVESSSTNRLTESVTPWRCC
jgi:hypothetical protein